MKRNPYGSLFKPLFPMRRRSWSPGGQEVVRVAAQFELDATDEQQNKLLDRLLRLHVPEDLDWTEPQLIRTPRGTALMNRYFEGRVPVLEIVWRPKGKHDHGKHWIVQTSIPPIRQASLFASAVIGPAVLRKPYRWP